MRTHLRAARAAAFIAFIALLAFTALCLPGCVSVIRSQKATPDSAGIRYFLPQPFILVTPNLDGSLASQYVNFLTNTAKGDFGISTSNDRPVRDIISDRFTGSVQLGIFAFLFAVTLGLTLGVLSAINQPRFSATKRQRRPAAAGRY